MSNRVEEQTGGSMSVPFPIGTYESGVTGSALKYVIGFVLAADGAVTGIEYKNKRLEADVNAEYGTDYTTCLADVYYHLPSDVSKITFATAVKLLVFAN